MYQLCPSILSADFCNLEEGIRQTEANRSKPWKKRGLNGFILMLWMVILYRVFLLECR